nr:MAG TPA: hypothetical protein [Caudoviricetes sp.]
MKSFQMQSFQVRMNTIKGRGGSNLQKLCPK